MRTWTIRARLTSWCAAVLGVVLILMAVATWIAMRNSFSRVIDQALVDRITSVGRFLNEPDTPASVEEMQEDLREYVALDPGWNLLRIVDGAGHLLYCSPAMTGAAVAQVEGSGPGEPPHFDDIALRGRALRLATAQVAVRGRRYVVQVAVPMTELEDALGQFRVSALLLVPVGLLAAAVGGYWISRRALAPVDRIATTARAITADRLDSRLVVPSTGDELQRLSETLNDMLGRLEAAFRETARFTADASHELRTPISLIRTSAELALRRPRTPDEYRTTLQDILREAERTSLLVQDLLLLARADAGVDTLSRDTIDLRQVLLDMRESLRALCADRHLELHLEDPPAPLPVTGNRAAIDRLILILAGNAVNYTSPPGSVSVSARRSDGALAVTVRDTGMGIADEDLPRVFDRFYRADKARSRDSGGAGLGLSIAKWIVEQHGGRIVIESEPGRGCQVQVFLPAADVTVTSAG
jgi:heavy metal sensor kinase